MNRLIAGAVAGLAATVPMSITMGAMFARLPRREKYPLPPREITDEVLHETGLRKHLSERSIAALTVASHFGYGTECGVVYGALEPRLPGPSLVKGMGFGLAVWTVSYLGWLPAFGILKPATEHPARRNALMIGAHLVWGAALAGIYEGVLGAVSSHDGAIAGRELTRDNMPLDDAFLRSVESPAGAPERT